MTDTAPDSLSLASVSGHDATTFLHAQCCGDLLSVADGAARLTAWCTARGRVITTLVACRTGQSWHLLLPGNIASRVLQRLRLFVLRADVTLALESEDTLARLRRECVIPGIADVLDADRGRPWVEAATSEQFLPQELDLERWGGLSYTKGCYPGQEIVARLRYRGATKRGLRRVLAAPDAADVARPGATLVTADGATRGTVLYAGAAGRDPLPLVAVVDHEIPDPGRLLLHPGLHPAEVCGGFT